MISLVAGLLLLASPLGSICAQTTEPAPETRTFELTAVAPPTPALKYELFYDTLLDRRPGNAAILYMQAILLTKPDVKEKSEKALDAYAAGDFKTFGELADAIYNPVVFDELELAARREQCDWQPPVRERGPETYLPHLEPLAHAITRSIKVRALRQIEQGKPDDALYTLRLGYELADKLGREPTMISALVSLAITSQMNDALAQLMARPDSPNLYWALSEFPGRRTVYQTALYGERNFLVPTTPGLPEAIQGKQLSAQQWKQMLDYIGRLDLEGRKSPPPPLMDPAILEKARDQYAQAHGVSAEQAQKIDPIIVVGEYYLRQARIIADDMFKLRGLAYPALLRKSEEVASRMDKVHRDEPGNPFLPLFDIHSASLRFMRVDRQFAALTAVEAVRSYSAANGGKLPARLEDVTDTPVPANPVTGKPFEYHVENGTASLSDETIDPPLRYTIKIRK